MTDQVKRPTLRLDEGIVLLLAYFGPLVACLAVSLFFEPDIMVFAAIMGAIMGLFMGLGALCGRTYAYRRGKVFENRSASRWMQHGAVLGAGCAIPLMLAIALPNLITVRISAGNTPALSALRTYVRGQNEFHKRDYYGIGRRVYANPVNGTGFPDLYKLGGPDADGPRLYLVDKALARATAPETPRAGYYFVEITADEHGPYDYSKQFGLCAVPVEYDRPSRRRVTFIVNHEGVVYACDTKGHPVTTWADVTHDEQGHGWIPCGLDDAPALNARR